MLSKEDGEQPLLNITCFETHTQADWLLSPSTTIMVFGRYGRIRDTVFGF